MGVIFLTFREKLELPFKMVIHGLIFSYIGRTPDKLDPSVLLPDHLALQKPAEYSGNYIRIQ